MINNGTVRSNPSRDNFYVNTYGDIENNGVWAPTNTNMKGDSNRTVTGTIGGGTAYFWGDFVLAGEPEFSATVHSYGNSTLTVDSSVTFAKVGSSLRINGSGEVRITDDIYGSIRGSISEVIFDAETVNIRSSVTIDTNVTITEGTVVQSDAYRWGRTLTIKGDVVNDGTLKSNDSRENFHVNTYGDISGGGDWEPSHTTTHDDYYRITVETGVDGSVYPDGIVTVKEETDKTFTFTADDGFTVGTVWIGDVAIGHPTSYTFENVTSDQTLRVNFEEIVHVIRVTSEGGGEIEPAGDILVDEGKDQTFTFKQNNGFVVDSIWINDEIIDTSDCDYDDDGNLTYTFYDVRRNHTVKVIFQAVDHFVTATAQANGSISPSGNVAVSHGDGREFTITPETGYRVADVLMDGTSVGAVTSYTLPNITGDRTISVSFELADHTITASAEAGGAISPGGEVGVTHGNDKAFTITPDTGYQVADVQVDGASVGAVTTYNFTNVTGNRSITASFELMTYTITATSGEGGTISPAGEVGVTHGSDQEFTITPDTGYGVADVLVDGTSVGAVTSYTFPNVTGDRTISVSFELADHTITAAAGEGGTISPADEVGVTHGSDKMFTITPDTGYQVADVRVDGASVGTVTTYNFTNVTGNRSITATFELMTYTITATSGEGGTISPAGEVGVTHGSDQEFTITPDTGYGVVDVLVDGVSVGSVTTYSFGNVTGDHTIHAMFITEGSTHTITVTADPECTVEPGGTVEVTHGDTPEFTVTADTGYRISAIAVSCECRPYTVEYEGAEVYVSNSLVFTTMVTSTTFMLADISEDCTVEVFAEPDTTHTIVWQTGGEGVVVVDGTGYIDSGFEVVNAGETLEMAFDGPILEGFILVDGELIEPVEVYTFDDDNYHVIEVGFPSEPFGDHTISVASFENGWIADCSSAGDNVYVNEGESVTFTMEPYWGYMLDDVLIDGVSVGAVDEYTFENITENHTIYATFVEDPGPFTITVNINGNGTVYDFMDNTYVNGDTFTVNRGDTVGLILTPDAGWRTGYVETDKIYRGELSPMWFSIYDIYGEGILRDHTFTVNFQPDDGTFDILYSEPQGGSVSPGTPIGSHGYNIVNVSGGSNPTFTFTPDAGMKVASVSGYGGESFFVSAPSSYTFTNIQDNWNFDVSFAGDDGTNYIQVWTSSGNGSISPSGIYVNDGDSQTFTFTPDSGYFVTDVEIDKVSIGAVSEYTFENVIGNHEVSAWFGNTHTITVTSGDNGEVDPSWAEVTHEDSQTFTMVPYAGYMVEDVLVDGVSVGAVSEYTFTNVTEAHEIQATFVEDPGPFDITLDISGSGTVEDDSANTYSDGNTVTVNKGDSINFSFTPDVGWRVGNLGMTSYSFSDVICDQTLAVNFRENDGTFDILLGYIENGNVDPSGVPIGDGSYHAVTVNEGGNQTLNFIPDAGYKFAFASDEWRWPFPSNGGLFVTESSSYTFTDVNEDRFFYVDFSPDNGKNSIYVTFPSMSGGSINPPPEEFRFIVNDGDSQTFTFTPDAGFHISEVVVDYVSVGAVSEYTFENVVGGHELQVYFEPN